MGRLIIDGNRVYTVDENCMRKKNLTYAQIKRHSQNEQNKNPPPKKGKQY